MIYRLPSFLIAGLSSLAALTLTGCFSFQPAGLSGPQQNTYLGQFEQPKDDNALLPDNVSFWDGGAGNGPARVHVRLGEQIADFYRGDVLVGRARISSGTSDRRTPTGRFSILEKDPDHRSSRYGDFVYPDGSFAKRDVDIKKDVPPPGTKFLGSPMFNFMRLTPDGVGMHTGYLPGYAASHGCIRMPAHMSKAFYDNVKLGTPVLVTQ